MKLTPEEVLALADINPELEQILDRIGPIRGVAADFDIKTMRKILAMIKKKGLAAAAASASSHSTPSYIEEDIKIPVRDNSSIDIRIHKPREKIEGGSPVLVIYHSGGFCIGDLDTQTEICRVWVGLGGVAVNVGYRLSPENAFPVPVEDGVDALKWTAANFEKFGGNPAKGFIVGGVSCGANIASIASLLYIEEELQPPLTGCYLSIPTLIITSNMDLLPKRYEDVFLSREQNSDAPVINGEYVTRFDGCYNTDPESKLCSPLKFTSQSKLPPTYFQVCGLDPLRDEALIYERILSEDNGIKTKLDLYPGLPHEFWAWFPHGEFTKKYRSDCKKGLEWLLDQSV